jgi:enolase
MRTDIVKILGREILDSRGNPTVEAEISLQDGTIARAAAPSGASTGEFEALELRDGDPTRFGGKGVQNAVKHINTVIQSALLGKDAAQTGEIDRLLCQLDGTPDKSRLGANGLLAVSLAAARAASQALQLPLYRFLGGVRANTLPLPMMNILNGGAHAANTVDVQEFMILPVGADSFAQGLQQCAEVYHTLAELLKQHGLATSVGDEGGFAPDLAGEEEALQYLISAIQKAGFTPGKDFLLALDAAASEWKSGQTGQYRLPKSGQLFTAEQLIEHWETLCAAYPICSIEDALDEEDWEGWRLLTERLGNQIQLVGDDLFVTNVQRLQKGIRLQCGNSILIKPNQIGTLSEAMEAVQQAQQAGYTTIISHRSGETEDTTIADLAVALNAGQIKTGAPNRSERVAKYNQLLRIEEALGAGGCYAGIRALR